MGLLVAVFKRTTGWTGRAIAPGQTITYDEARHQFFLEGQSPLSAQDVLSFDERGEIDWPAGDLREWVTSYAEWERQHLSAQAAEARATGRDRWLFGLFAKLRSRKQMNPTAQVFLWAQVACLLAAVIMAVLATLSSLPGALVDVSLALAGGILLCRFGEELYQGRRRFVMLSDLAVGAAILALALMMLSSAR